METGVFMMQLFGPLRVLVHGQPLPRLRTRSVEWLLALLVLRHGRSVDRSWLAGTLWPESGESQSLENLRHDLVTLRKALGSEGMRIQSPARGVLTFDLADADVDLLRFDSGIRMGDEDSLLRAVESYSGPLLEGCLEEWVSAEREIREQQYLRALETLAGIIENRGDLVAALSLIHRAASIDPLRDSTQRGLMRLLAASGDTPAALMTYREHRLRLRREMNGEPDEETNRLAQQIRAAARAREEDTAGKREEGRGKRITSTPQHPDAQRLTPDASDPNSSLIPHSSSLPHPLTTLIGREEQVQEILEQIVDSRLVTLVGAGGVGKTRLVLEVAREAAEDFAEGVVFVPLASLSDPTLLPAFVAAALGMREEAAPEPAMLLQALLHRLTTRALLLVLDNCEHLIQATAVLAQALLETCPHLHILATSRQRLGLTGEILCRVPSLPSPDPNFFLDFGFSILDWGSANPKSKIQNPKSEEMVAFVLQYPAVQLFIERAAMVRPGFRLSRPEEALAVAQVCHRLDGIPRAIELAAARTSLLTVEQIAARLTDRFRLLTGGSRGVLPRHQTLRALIDWSYEQLTDAERVLLSQLSVFVDGWTLEAAEAVASSRDEGKGMRDEEGAGKREEGRVTPQYLRTLTH